MKNLMTAVFALICAVSGVVKAQNLNFPETPKEFDMKYFSATKVKPEIKTIPFTAEELIKLAPDKIHFSRGRVSQVTIHKRIEVNGVKTRVTMQVPLDKYLAEINAYETFLNKYGETLRDGKFSKTNSNSRVQSDMGVLFALRHRSSKIQPPKLTVLAYDPQRLARFIPYDPTGILNLSDRIRVNPGDRVVSPIQSAITVGNRGFNPNNYYQRRADGSRLHVVNGKIAEIIIGAEKSYGGRVLRVSSGPAPNSGCPPKTKRYDGGPFLPPEGKSPCNAAPSSSITSSFPDFCSPFSPAEGDPTCLYDGKIDASGIELGSVDINSEGGGNGWFGGYASFDLMADVQQQGNRVVLTNTGLTNVGVEILGSKINLVEATNNTKFDNQSGQNALQTDVKATALPDTLKADLRTSFDQIIPGPGTMFFIRPVPISITSEFQAILILDKTQPPFQKLPDSCASSQTGAMTMSLDLDATAKVTLRAAVDAIVASAGIKGELVLVAGNLTGTTTTEVAPSINKITFKPKVSYKLQYLAGHVYLFVELDLLLYSKEWKIEVISFDGFNPDDELSPSTPRVISSKRNNDSVRSNK